jgi:pimeloyl-ACP methyl ester carboxylesterase
MDATFRSPHDEAPGLNRERTFYVNVQGQNLEVQRIPGSASDAPELIFLHEGLGSISHWKDFPVRVAAVTGCPVTVYSRYGSGNSDPLTEPRALNYMHDEALHSLPDLFGQLRIGNPILIGHSDGASIALIYTGACKSVRGLVLLAPHVFVEDLSVPASLKLKQVSRPRTCAKNWPAIIATPPARSGDGITSGSIPPSAAGTSKNTCLVSPAPSSPSRDSTISTEPWRRCTRSPANPAVPSKFCRLPSVATLRKETKPKPCWRRSQSSCSASAGTNQVTAVSDALKPVSQLRVWVSRPVICHKKQGFSP